MINRHWRAISGLIGILVFSSSLGVNAQQNKTNLGELKKQIELFETILNQSLTQAFGGPFDTLDKAQGAYLPGYGVVFAFEVSLSPLQNLGPFSAAPTSKSEQAQGENEIRRRDKAKAVAAQVLANFAQTLNLLATNESVAIIIHTVAAHPNKIERSTIVVSAERKLIEERQTNTIDQAQFVRNLRTTEY
jgi:hypothetical protein